VSAARALCGDACDPKSYRAVLGTERARLLLTDPPYCLLTRRRKGGDLRDPKGRKIDREPVVRFETVRDYRRFTETWLPLAVGALEPGALLVIWTNFLGREPILGAARTLGYLHVQAEFVWAKRTTDSRGSEQLLRVYETALVLARTAATRPGPGEPAVPASVVAGYDDDGEATRWGNHPHHKPFGVLEPLIRTYSRPGELVLDPFGGSGSIAAAAVRLERRAAVLELVPEWAARIDERLRTA
jgi:site-specific DNA-methyltransferase (adenine-specific)